MKRIVTINYNTPDFVEKLILSINKHVSDASITVFDNSDKQRYINHFSNVDVIDNTDGSIIDFNSFLSMYPKRNMSTGRLNMFGSAKHCYTVEKCIEMIDHNFILMDSDVLLKRDISDLFDDSCIYVAEELTQGNGIKRVSPHLCFINAEMCRKNDVHYFDDRYMHGLFTSLKSDQYDTGAGFLINARDFKHRNIRYEDYIVHYGHGSWNDRSSKKPLTPDEFFTKYNEYWNEIHNDI